MDKRLNTLIYDYLQAVQAALTLMQLSGITLPKTSSEWVRTDWSSISSLKSGITYVKHGAGCLVDLPDGSVDFDFGKSGEICGFDAWRLVRFANNNWQTYNFISSDELQNCFDKAVRNKELTPLASNLYFVTKDSLKYVSSIDTRSDSDMLPHRDLDCIHTLHVHYFLSADLMHDNYRSLANEFNAKRKLSRDKEVNLRIYLSAWLGFLAVTCEGFQDLKIRSIILNERPNDFEDLIPKADKVNSTISKHFNDLRKYRNNLFHFRSSLNDTVAFFAPDKNLLAWASDTHQALKCFFSEYRISSECHYIMHERHDEADVGQR